MTGAIFATGALLALALVGGAGVALTLAEPGAQAAPKASASADPPGTQGPGPTQEPGENPTDGPSPEPSQEPTQPPGHDSDPKEEGPAKQEGDTIHPVAPGDTLSSISKEYGVSVDQLVKYNEIDDPDLIYAGSALRVPYLLIPQVDPETGEITSP